MDEVSQILDLLAARFCERKALRRLFRFLPAYYARNGLTDGWELCRQGLAETRAFCGRDLKPDELEDIHRAMNLINRMLTER